jgi:hypothetical protein
MRPLLLSAIIATGLAACGSSISTDRDPSIPIPAAATYSWGGAGAPELPGERDPSINNELVHNRIRQAIDREMAGKGFRHVNSGGDFLVHYHIGLEPKTATVVNSSPSRIARPFIRCGAGRCWTAWRWSYWGPPEVYVREDQYFEGSLLIDLTQSSSGKLVWRGIGRERVDEPQVSEDDIGKTVREIVDKIPITM